MQRALMGWGRWPACIHNSAVYIYIAVKAVHVHACCVRCAVEDLVNLSRDMHIGASSLQAACKSW